MITTGLGYDIHRFSEGRPLVLGGIVIPHHRGLQGHSDADVLTHAIADALLGAIGERDIGHHFPDTDESIRGICSLEILSHARELVTARRATINNIDATLIAEEPRVMKHAPAMKAQIAAALGIQPDAVGIKATTNEAMGFIGRREGIAAMAVASVGMG